MAGPACWAILGLYGLAAVWPRTASPSIDWPSSLLLLAAWWGALFVLPRAMVRWARRILRYREWIWLVTGLACCRWCGTLPVAHGETTQLWDGVRGLLVLAVGWWIMETSLFGLVSSAPRAAEQSGTWGEFRGWASSMWLAPSALMVVLLVITDAAIWLVGSAAIRVNFGAQLGLALLVAGLANSLPAQYVRRASSGRRIKPPWPIIVETRELARVAGIVPPAIGLGWQRSSARLIAVWGLTSRSAVIWLSPAVVALPEGVRRCLIAHEMAHIRAGHAARRAVLLVFLAGLSWVGIAELGAWGRLERWSPTLAGGLTLGLTLVSAGLGGLIFRGVARDFELQADRDACRLLARWRGGSGREGTVVPDRELAESYLAALAELTGAAQGGWLHPSWLVRRRRLLAELAVDRVRAWGGADSSPRPACSLHSAVGALDAPISRLESV